MFFEANKQVGVSCKRGYHEDTYISRNLIPRGDGTEARGVTAFSPMFVN